MTWITDNFPCLCHTDAINQMHDRWINRKAGKNAMTTLKAFGLAMTLTLVSLALYSTTNMLWVQAF